MINLYNYIIKSIYDIKYKKYLKNYIAIPIAYSYDFNEDNKNLEFINFIQSNIMYNHITDTFYHIFKQLKQMEKFQTQYKKQTQYKIFVETFSKTSFNTSLQAYKRCKPTILISIYNSYDTIYIRYHIDSYEIITSILKTNKIFDLSNHMNRKFNIRKFYINQIKLNKIHLKFTYSENIKLFFNKFYKKYLYKYKKKMYYNT